jgi:hypothetical protein
MNENGEKGRTKITALNRNPRGQEEDLGLHSHTKSQQNTPRIFRSCDLSHETLEDLTLGGRGKNESGREVRRQGAAILYLTGLFYIPLNAPRYIRAKPISPRA